MLQVNKLTKIIILLLTIVLMIVCTLVFTSTINEKPRSIYKTQNIYDQFKLDNISIKSFNREDLFLTLKAEKIVHRDRTLGFFKYHNLKEIYLSDLELEFYPDESFYLSDKSIPDMIGNELLKNIENASLEEWNIVRQGDEPYFNISNTVAEPDYKIITRIVIDNPSIIVHLKNNSLVKISSDNAVMNIDSRNIEFKGNFSIVDANHKTIYAPEAVCKYKSNIIFFPKGYTLFSFRHTQEEAFAIDAFGSLRKVANQANDKYKKDRIEEMEKILVAKYIAPYLNAFYMSLLTKNKVDPAIFKKQRYLFKHN